MSNFIALKNDSLEVIIHPEAGGSIFSFKYNHNGNRIDIMRPTPMEAAERKEAGKYSSFNLIPYSSLLENGMLKMNNEFYPLYPKDPSQHREHGEVRIKPLKVERHDQSSVLLSFDSTDFDDIYWPFPFTALLEYSLTGSTFKARMTLKNTGDHSMPGGLGMHPYFVRNLEGIKQDVFVRIPMKGAYPQDDQIPLGPWEQTDESEEFSKGKILSGDHLDKCYRLSSNTYFIRWETSRIKLTFKCNDVFGHTVIYCPPDNDAYFALEPVSHVNNAFNMHEAGIKDTGTVILKPGGEMTGIVEMTVEEC